MFTMVNTLNKKQIQYNQELKEIETMKSDKEIQFIHLQVQAQWNKVPERRDFRRFNILSLSSKMQALRSCQTNHIKHAGTIFQMVERCIPNQFL